MEPAWLWGVERGEDFYQTVVHANVTNAPGLFTEAGRVFLFNPKTEVGVGFFVIAQYDMRFPVVAWGCCPKGYHGEESSFA